jgi:hypothetical protein
MICLNMRFLSPADIREGGLLSPFDSGAGNILSPESKIQDMGFLCIKEEIFLANLKDLLHRECFHRLRLVDYHQIAGAELWF